MSMAIGRRELLLGGAAALGAAVLGGAASAAPLDKVTAKGTLRLAVYKDFQPWSWQRDGTLVGIDVDLGRAFAERMGVKPDFLELMADESVEDDLRNAVWRGGLLGLPPADVMLHVPYDRQFALRNDRVAIVAPYYRESFAMACDREALDCELPPPQLKGRKLAAEIDSIPDFYLTGSFGGVLRGDVKHYPSGMAALEAVKAGGAEAALATRAQVEHAMQTGGAKMVQRKGPLPALPSPGWDVGLAVKDDSRDLGDKLEALLGQMAADGALAAIFARYGVQPRPPLAAT